MTLMKSHKLLIVIERGPLLAIGEQMCGGSGAALDLTELTSSPRYTEPPPHTHWTVGRPCLRQQMLLRVGGEMPSPVSNNTHGVSE